MSEQKRPILTVDVAIFTLLDGRLHVLLMEREHTPFKGALALAGGYIHVEEDEDTLAGAHRVAKSKLGMNVSYMEQLGTFSGKDRDPRGWSASVVYLAMVGHQQRSVATPLRFCPTDELPKLAFDHNKLIDCAVKRIETNQAIHRYRCFLCRRAPLAWVTCNWFMKQ